MSQFRAATVINVSATLKDQIQCAREVPTNEFRNQNYDDNVH